MQELFRMKHYTDKVNDDLLFFSVVDEDGDSDADTGNEGGHVEVDEDDDSDADADADADADNDVDADDADDAQDDEDDEADDDTAVDEAEEMPDLSKRYVRAVKNFIRSFKTKLPWSKVRNPLLNFKCQKRVFVRKKVYGNDSFRGSFSKCLYA